MPADRPEGIPETVRLWSLTEDTLLEAGDDDTVVAITWWGEYELAGIPAAVRESLSRMVLGPVSIIAAKMALATKYQDKYVAAHDALMGTASRLTESRIRELLAGAGIDVDRAARDLETNAKAIDVILARNHDQATAFGFKGTPAFIIGKFRVPGVLTMAQFDQAIADARKAAKKK